MLACHVVFGRTQSCGSWLCHRQTGALTLRVGEIPHRGQHLSFTPCYRAGRLHAKAFLLMEILRPLFCVNRGELPAIKNWSHICYWSPGRYLLLKSGKWSHICYNGFVFGGWAGVVVGRHLERQAAIEQERRLASFPPQLGTSRSQGTRRKRHPGSPVCF